MNARVLESTLTCPACGQASLETMPTDACLFFWDCPACGVRAKPKAGDCCVFCSYGSVRCPPMQMERGGCIGQSAQRCGGVLGSEPLA